MPPAETKNDQQAYSPNNSDQGTAIHLSQYYLVNNLIVSVGSVEHLVAKPVEDVQVSLQLLREEFGVLQQNYELLKSKHFTLQNSCGIRFPQFQSLPLELLKCVPIPSLFSFCSRPLNRAG